MTFSCPMPPSRDIQKARNACLPPSGILARCPGSGSSQPYKPGSWMNGTCLLFTARTILNAPTTAVFSGQAYLDSMDVSICPESYRVAEFAASATLSLADAIMAGQTRQRHGAHPSARTSCRERPGHGFFVLSIMSPYWPGTCRANMAWRKYVLLTGMSITVTAPSIFLKTIHRCSTSVPTNIPITRAPALTRKPEPVAARVQPSIAPCPAGTGGP